MQGRSYIEESSWKGNKFAKLLHVMQPWLFLWPVDDCACHVFTRPPVHNLSECKLGSSPPELFHSRK
eukprot:515778-Amphidinium_carterae.1